MGNNILDMINDRKNKDYFVQKHPLKVKLSIEEKIYYLSAIKYLVGENNDKLDDYLAMISESFNISEDIYNDEEINLMEDGLNVLNSLDLRAKSILIMDIKIIVNSKDIFDILQIDNSIVEKIDYLFNLITEKNSEKILDFFEENNSFTIKDYIYLMDYFDIDISAMQKRKDDDRIAQLDELDGELKAIYKSLLLSKEYIKRELDKSMNTGLWRSDFLTKNLPIYIREEISYEDYDDIEDYFESDLEKLRGWFRGRMILTRNGAEQGINNILKITNNEYNERKKVISALLSNNKVEAIALKFKKLEFKINVKSDIKLPETSYPMIKVRSKMKKKMWSKERYVVLNGKISWIPEYKEMGRNSVDKIWNDTSDLVYNQLSDFVDNEITKVSKLITELKSKVGDNRDIKLEFMDISNLDLEESTTYIKALGLIIGVDNKIDENEEKYLLNLMKKLGVDKKLDEVLNFKELVKDNLINKFKELFFNNIAKNNFIFDAYKISLLDGNIKEENQELIDYFVNILEIEVKASEKILEKAKDE